MAQTIVNYPGHVHSHSHQFATNIQGDAIMHARFIQNTTDFRFQQNIADFTGFKQN